MRHRIAGGLLVVALGVAASVAVAEVKVRFVDAERFVDATLEGYGDKPETNRVLLELKEHLLALGARCIPPEDSLEILVREIDLAGDYDWRHRAAAGSFRALPNVAWSRMTIEYEWRSGDGRLVARSIDRLGDAKYLSDPKRSRAWDVTLPDEKAMLTEWFEPRFCRRETRTPEPRARP
jgi:hypothetical protein